MHTDLIKEIDVLLMVYYKWNFWTYEDDATPSNCRSTFEEEKYEISTTIDKLFLLLLNNGV